MSDATIRQFNKQALDPAASVVIEACAGSGKTWLLVSRIVRLLLEDVPPSQILAMTFTRKAAQEMAARLREWLFILATSDRDAVRRFLREREVPAERIDTLAARARLLYERVLTAQPAITITTFHSWFMQLLRRAPLDAGVPGDVSLVEQTAALVDEAWQRFASSVQRDSGSAAARGLDTLFRDCGLESTRRLLTNFLRRRAEWWAYTRGRDDPVVFAMSRIAGDMEVAPDADILGPLFGDAELDAALAEYAGFLERGTARDQPLAQALAAARREPDAPQRFELAWSVVFTGTGTLRTRKSSAAQARRFTAEGEVRFLALHTELGARLHNARDALAAQENYRFNEAALSCGAGLLAAYQELKAERQVIDYGDIEWRAWELIRESDHAAYMHCKLDARYRHVLVDEFQDTNPLQWLTLRSWLAAAAEADSRPTVFMVGDPRQSIYRFRRAEARLFDQAQDYLQREFGAHRLTQNESRRCAPPVIEVVNGLFGAEARFTGFSAHTAHFTGKPGRVEVLPLAAAGVRPDAAPAAGLALRNPLAAPLEVEEDRRREREAQMLTARIGEIVGGWQVAGAPGARARPARHSDIMVLVRRRTHLAVYERALRHAGIPYVTSRQGGLLDTLEAQDLVALLEFLTAPFADLKLAHALRSPVFGAADEDLIALAAAGEGHWWERLQRLARDGGSSPALERAHELLARWLERADTLPVHDQLDRIYFEGEVMGRYHDAVPPAMRGAVAANLHAFMQRALDTDAGRYPSLPRFIHELADLRAAPAEDAPDEGIAGDAGDAVRIYTVHGAKGLEAPIVWLLDTAAGQGADRGYDALVDWPPQAEQPAQFSLWGRKESQSAAQRALAATESDLGAREELNLLYVAMTRAGQALIVSGADGRGREGSWYERIRAAACAAAGSGAGDPSQSVVCGGALASARDEEESAVGEKPPAAAVDPRLARPLPTGARVPAPAGRGLAYGTHFHLLMERLAADPRAGRDGLARSLGLPAREFAPLWAEAQRLLANPGLARFFDRAHYVRALNEVSLVTSAGAVRRIDRLVESQQEIWVLDYKTGEAPEGGALMAEYEAQIAEYRTSIAEMFPGKLVRAMLIFSGGATREVAVKG